MLPFLLDAAVAGAIPIPPLEVLLPLLGFAASWGVARAKASTTARDIELLRAEIGVIVALRERLATQEGFKEEVLRRLDEIRLEQKYQHTEHKRLVDEVRDEMLQMHRAAH